MTKSSQVPQGQKLVGLSGGSCRERQGAGHGASYHTFACVLDCVSQFFRGRDFSTVFRVGYTSDTIVG
jgi:hypothetical protein